MTENYIWLLENTVKYDSITVDHIIHFVISAKDENKVRLIAAGAAMDEGFEVWMNPVKSTCEKIGMAFSSDEKIIVIDMPGL